MESNVEKVSKRVKESVENAQISPESTWKSESRKHPQLMKKSLDLNS